MTKFEYRIIDHDMFDGSILDTMSFLGAEGWEVIRILDPMKYVNSDGLFIRIFYQRKTTKD